MVRSPSGRALTFQKPHPQVVLAITSAPPLRTSQDLGVMRTDRKFQPRTTHLLTTQMRTSHGTTSLITVHTGIGLAMRRILKNSTSWPTTMMRRDSQETLSAPGKTEFSRPSGSQGLSVPRRTTDCRASCIASRSRSGHLRSATRAQARTIHTAAVRN